MHARSLPVLILLVAVVVFHPPSFTSAAPLYRLYEFPARGLTTIQCAAIDDSGNTFVTGLTDRPEDLPPPRIQLGTPRLGRHLFVMKLSPDGTALGSITLGGFGDNEIGSMALDSAGHVIVVGTTTATNFPLVNALPSGASGQRDVFVCKVDGSGTNLLFSTRIGGDGDEQASAVAVGGDGVFVSGSTTSTNFPTTTRITPSDSSGSVHAFIFRLNFTTATDATLSYATLVGGSAGQTVTAMTVDAAGQAYILGQTTSLDFPLVNAVQSFPQSSGFGPMGYVAKLASDGTHLIYSSYLTGSCEDHPQSIAVNTSGEAVIVGATCSPEVLPAEPIPDGNFYSGWSAFLVRLSADGSQVVDRQLRRYSNSDEFKAVLARTNDTVLLVGGIHTHSVSAGSLFTIEMKGESYSPEQLLTSGCAEQISLLSAAINGAGQLVLTGVDVQRSTPGRLHTWVATAHHAADAPHVHIVEPVGGTIVPPNYGFSITAAATGFTNPVTLVEFYEGPTLIGIASNAPFRIDVSGNGMLRRTFQAKAIAGNQSATSCVVQVIQKSPRNDNFSGRRRLAGERIRVRGTTEGATTEPMDSGMFSSVWYSWRAPRQGTFEFSVTPNDRVMMSIFTGKNLSQLSTVLDRSASPATLRVEQGKSYHVRVNSGRFGDSPFELRIRPVTAPRNDDFADAQLITGTNTPIIGTLQHATREPNEGYYFADVTVWYRWQAPADGLYFVSLTNRDVIPSIMVFQGGLPYSWMSISRPVSGYPSGSTFQAKAGEEHWISVMGVSAILSNFSFTVTRETPPPNDHFDSSAVVVGEVIAVAGSTLGATNAGWYTWTAPQSGLYRIAAQIATASLPGRFPWPYMNLTVYSGNDPESLVYLTGGNYRHEAILRATEGVTYHIAVSSGLSTFEFQIHPVPLLPNDDYTSPTLLNSGTPVSVSGSLRYATPEPADPYGDATTWYRWFAPSNGLFTIRVLPDRLSAAVYTGDAFDTAQLLYQSPRPLIRATAGQEFRIGISNPYRSHDFAFQIVQLEQPANDDFANSITVEGTNAVFTAHVANATVEPDESGSLGNPRHTVWFTWTAPVDGLFSLRFTSASKGLVSVHVGDTLDNLTEVAYSWSELLFGAQAGVTYRWVVDDVQDYGVDLELELRQVLPPENDNFADRVFLHGAPVTVTGTLVGASIEADEPRHGGINLKESVWWSWTAPKSGRAQLDLSRVFLLSAYTGDSLESLNPVTATSSALDFSVEAGVTYQIAVADDIGWTLGDFQFDLTILDPPANDSFAQRTRLFRRGRGTTQGASREIGEVASETDPGGASVWWTWRAPRDGVYDIVLSTSSVAARLYTGNQLDQLVPVEGAAAFDQTLRFHAVRGTPYIIEVFSPNNLGTDYQIQILRRRPPSNDSFDQRLRLNGTHFTVGGNNGFATAESGEPAHGLDSPHRSLWWTWTPPSNGVVFINFKVDATRAIAFYAGGRLDELTYVAAGGADFNFEVMGGVELQMAVDGSPFSSDAMDPWEFEVLLVPRPANDNFDARAPLVGANVHTIGTFIGASIEESEPLPDYVFPHSIWWSWIVPETGSYTFRIKATNNYPHLMLYTGLRLDALELVASAARGSEVAEVSLPLIAGHEIAIVAAGWFQTSEDRFELTVNKVSPPTNDHFANRTELLGGRAVGSNEGASLEPGEPNVGVESIGSVWWRFTAASTGWHVLGAWLTNSVGDPSGVRAVLFTGDSITNLGVVHASERHSDPRYWLTAGMDYSIRVSGYDQQFGTIALELYHVPSPANDAFTDAALAVGEHFSIAASNAWATTEPGEPLTYYPWIGATVWWRWTPARDGVYVLATPGSSHWIGVYTGPTYSNLIAVHQIAYGAPANGFFFQAHGGVEHYLRVASDFWMESAFILQLDGVQPPVNDDFTNRTALVGSSISISASNYFATPEPGDPLASSLGEQTVWWSWTAPVSGPVSVNVAHYSSLRFRVFTGSHLTNLVPRTSSSPFGPQTFDAVAGLEYQIGATTYSDYASEFTVTIEATQMAFGASQTQRTLLLKLTQNSQIETSTNLVDWLPYRASSSDEPEMVVEPILTEPHRFFRVR